MKFCFLQPELRSASSDHFFQYLISVKKAINRKKLSVSILANEIFKGPAEIPVQPVFRNHVYKSAGKLTVLWRIFINNFFTKSEFRKVMMEQVTQEDTETVFLVDTILNDRIIALAYAFKSIARTNKKCRLVVCFRFSYQSNSSILTGLQQWLHRRFCGILSEKIITGRVCMYTDSSLLQQSYCKNIPYPVQVWPIPLETEYYSLYAKKKTGRTRVSVIGFIGGSVAYKGLDSFIRILISITDDEPGYLIHGITNFEELLDFSTTFLSMQELEKLRLMQPRIQTLAKLDEQGFRSLYDKMDMILIPYTSLQFREGTSNIFAEAIAASVIPVVPSGTWMSSELRKENLDMLDTDFTNIPKAVQLVENSIRNYGHLLGQLSGVAANWRKFHSSDSFADLLTANIA